MTTARTAGRGPAPPPRGRSKIWRADLVRLLVTLPVEEVEAAAAQLGFEKPKAQSMRRKPTVAAIEAPVAPPVQTAQVNDAAPLPLFRLDEVTFSDAAHPKAERSAVPELRRADFYHPDYAMAFTPPSPPLSPWSRLWPVLHQGLRSQTPSRDPDLPKLLFQWSRGEVAARLPCLPRPAWAQRIAVWVDRSPRLAPFFSDQALVYKRLLRVCGRSALTVRVLSSRDQATVVAQRSDHAAGQALNACQTVLVLGDLGAYGSTAEQDAWRRTQQRLARAGVRSMALLPVPRARWPQRLSRSWSAASWERGRTAQLATAGAQGVPQVDPGVERLLRLLSPAEFVEPGLLRALRYLLPAGSTDAATEVEVYRHPDVRAADTTGLVLSRDAAAQHRQRFATEEPAEIKEQVSRTIAQFHARLPRQLVYFETLTWLGLVPAAQAPPPGSASDAQTFAARIVTSLRRGSEQPELTPQLRRAAQSLLQSLPDAALTEQPALQRLWVAAYAGVAGVRVPSGLDRKLLDEDGPTDAPPRHFSLRQVGDALVCQGEASGAWPSHDTGPGSPVAWLSTVGHHLAAQWSDEPRSQWWPLQDGVRIPLRSDARLQLRTIDRTLTLTPWSREPWAVAAGRDRYGLWADAEVEGIPLRFRWIPPGRFLMGSPEDEAGRYDNEGPQHKVTLTQGYWLADTPCTQAVWQALMGANPSRFQSPDRPVEQVSWNDCQEFVRHLNGKQPGLSIRLPSEAEWEHACRAGTQTATWLGDLEILGENNAPLLDPIAWYGGNSGQNFELDEHEDSSGWPGKQHPDSSAGTHSVRGKTPNHLGLFDVLGNVYEWCVDGYTPYGGEPLVNPVQPSVGANRVLRGGSWYEFARRLRAARRNGYGPGIRLDVLGFRLARGGTGGQVGREVEQLLRLPLNALLCLDRTTQYRLLLDGVIPRRRQNQILLLHGRPEQNLEWFIRRVEQFMMDDTGCRVVTVPLRHNNAYARTPTDWSRHLMYALETQLGESSLSLPALIAQASKRLPLMLLLVADDNPLSVLGALSARQRTWLGDFVATHLPELLTNSRCSGITVLLALEVGKSDEAASLLTEAQGWLAKGWQRDGCTHQVLPEVHFPSWDDVTSYLHSLHPPLKNLDRVLLESKEAYAKFGPESAFEQLARALNHIVVHYS